MAQLFEEEKACLRDTIEANLIKLHFLLDLWIRNSFGLWMGNRSLAISCEARDENDASMAIIRRAWAKVNGD